MVIGDVDKGMKSKTKDAFSWFPAVCIGILLLILAGIAYRLSLIFTTDWPVFLSGMTISDWMLTAAAVLLLVLLRVFPKGNGK